MTYHSVNTEKESEERGIETAICIQGTPRPTAYGSVRKGRGSGSAAEHLTPIDDSRLNAVLFVVDRPGRGGGGVRSERCGVVGGGGGGGGGIEGRTEARESAWAFLTRDRAVAGTRLRFRKVKSGPFCCTAASTPGILEPGAA